MQKDSLGRQSGNENAKTHKNEDRRSKARLQPCDKPQAAEASRPIDEEEACDDGVK